jgi:glycosyltransferase involved in cell wall biosynthesis
MNIVFFANTEWYLYNFRLPLARALRNQGHVVLMVSPPGPYGRCLEAEGFEWHPVPMNRRSLHPLREVGLINRLRKLLVQRKVDLIHGFTIKCAVYGALAARLAGDRPRVNAVAGLGYLFSSDEHVARLGRLPIRALMQVAFGGNHSRVIVQNGEDRRVFQRSRMANSERLVLIPGSGVDTARFVPNTERQSRRPFRVVMAARLLKSKGVGEFAAAAGLLRDRGVVVECVLAGAPDPGNPDSLAEAQVAAWARQGLLVWKGHLDDVRDLYSEADAVALPSYYGEGLPRSLLEGGACGLPLITTARPGCRDVVTHEVEGLLVAERSATALADAIERLTLDRAWACRLGEAARRKVVTEFDERLVIERTFAVYGSLLPGFVEARARSPGVNVVRE